MQLHMTAGAWLAIRAQEHGSNVEGYAWGL